MLREFKQPALPGSSPGRARRAETLAAVHVVFATAAMSCVEWRSAQAASGRASSLRHCAHAVATTGPLAPVERAGLEFERRGNARARPDPAGRDRAPRRGRSRSARNKARRRRAARRHDRAHAARNSASRDQLARRCRASDALRATANGPSSSAGAAAGLDVPQAQRADERAAVVGDEREPRAGCAAVAQALAGLVRRARAPKASSSSASRAATSPARSSRSRIAGLAAGTGISGAGVGKGDGRARSRSSLPPQGEERPSHPCRRRRPFGTGRRAGETHRPRHGHVRGDAGRDRLRSRSDFSGGKPLKPTAEYVVV